VWLVWNDATHCKSNQVTGAWKQPSMLSPVTHRLSYYHSRPSLTIGIAPSGRVQRLPTQA